MKVKFVVGLRKCHIICALLLIFFFDVIAQPANEQSPVSSSDWKGYQRLDFKIKNKDAWLVVPNKALPGNPWLWRARFPGYHSEADSILVSAGFYLAHINTAGMFGNQESMEIWDVFYEYLIGHYDLDEKVSLAGVSRGGLFIYTWAKRNPDKVHCIYGDAPVCDFKSWPAGFGASNGDKDSWELLKKQYGFESDEEARAYGNNPVDNLEMLAKEKIPVLHMIGLNDEIVPVDENTFVLVNTYLKLGGPATVIPCTQGKQTLQGHHFPIETPRLVADFIKYHTLNE
jgi:pimeloyl-ACP methyl ester carboxylesterase